MTGPVRLLQYFMLALALAGVFYMQYLLPLVSRYECPVKQYFKNAAFLTVSFFPRTLLLGVLHIAELLVFVIFWAYVLPFYLMIAVSGTGFLVMKICDPIFRRIEEDMQEPPYGSD